MPQMIQMRALVAFDRNGKSVKAGDLFSVFPIEAASLRFRKQAEFAPNAKPPAPPPAPARREQPPTPEEATTRTAAPAAPQTQQADVPEQGEAGRRTTNRSMGGRQSRRDLSASEG